MVFINRCICCLFLCTVVNIFLLITMPCNRNVEELIRFPDVKVHRQLTYGAKQLIAREVN